MRTKLNPLSFVSNEKTYEWWKSEITAWELVNDLPKAKTGTGIPDNDSSKIREQVFEETSAYDLAKETGIKTLLDFIDLKLGKEDLEHSLEKYEELNNYKTSKKQKITEFI